MSVQDYMQQLGKQAKQAAATLLQQPTAEKNAALLAMAEALSDHRDDLKTANAQDMAKAQANNLDAAMLDRLQIDNDKIDAMIVGVKQIIELPDPVGTISDMNYLPSGIQVGKMRMPLGVVGIIYESRPNVTIDAASLCLKSGNCAILRGGSEALHTNQAIAKCVLIGLRKAGLPEHAIQIVSTTDREVVGQLITLTDYVDVIVPRGGKSLIERISRDAKIPVIKHLDGNCHVYIDDQADAKKAIAIAFNAKTRRYGVCNAMETLLIAASRAEEILPTIVQQLSEKQVELRACEQTRQLLQGMDNQACLKNMVIKAATGADWYEEYLAPVLAVKIIEGMDAAITHINHYGSHHTDGIVTDNYTKARAFMAQVDSSSVMINASIAFADGFEYGLGAEIGISTDKIHVRGPVGLEGLTSQKYVVFGDGHIRS